MAFKLETRDVCWTVQVQQGGRWVTVESCPDRTSAQNEYHVARISGRYPNKPLRLCHTTHETIEESTCGA
jgi:hypothetical protein